jgi:hypothetical protein
MSSMALNKASQLKSGASAKTIEIPRSQEEVGTLQEASAKYLILKNKTKQKSDQAAMDFLASVEYHRTRSVEADLFHRFFTQIYSD